jgi:DNA mismatch repair ATPase MutS
MIQPFFSQSEIIQTYLQTVDQHQSAIQKLKKIKRSLSFARLVVVILGVAACWLLPVSFFFFIAIIGFAAGFIFLVFRDADKSSTIKNHERLVEIIRHEVNAMQHQLSSYDDGHIYVDAGHAYAADLDLFGPASLFQWLNRCHAEQSKKLLSDLLKSPMDHAFIAPKQLAVKELAVKQDYCQQFQSMAMANPLTFETESRLKKWMGLPSGPFENPVWKWLLIIYPLITLSALTLYLFAIISGGTFLFYCIGFLLISFSFSKKINPVYELLSRIQPEMDSLHEQLQLLEKETFNAAFLKSLQNRLKPAGYESSSAAIRLFHIILKKFEYRLNLVVFMFINAFFLWDLRQVVALHEWKKNNQSQLSDSFSVIAEMEVCISIASLVHNEPSWCFPEVDANYFHFNAEAIGHPLIHPDVRVPNDYSMKGTGRIAIITGSNMAGKSTFLRSLGINTVLALLGAPTCARRLQLSNMKLISSMRVADNLAENTSTFYAELKKLKYIIDAANRREHSFILLDEVLRGTNSTDRHKGSRALIRQLLQGGAVAIMATHDTELAHAEAAANKAVTNYYFEGQIIGEDLFFDYRIKKGICESLNATTLMKKIGIHFEE